MTDNKLTEQETQIVLLKMYETLLDLALHNLIEIELDKTTISKVKFWSKMTYNEKKYIIEQGRKINTIKKKIEINLKTENIKILKYLITQLKTEIYDYKDKCNKIIAKYTN